MFDEKIYSFNLGNQEIKISTGKIARQAGGSVIVQCGGTVLLVTATRSKDVKEASGFFSAYSWLHWEILCIWKISRWIYKKGK